jgi:hypothetical protein
MLRVANPDFRDRCRNARKDPIGCSDGWENREWYSGLEYCRIGVNAVDAMEGHIGYRPIKGIRYSVSRWDSAKDSISMHYLHICLFMTTNVLLATWLHRELYTLFRIVDSAAFECNKSL